MSHLTRPHRFTGLTRAVKTLLLVAMVLATTLATASARAVTSNVDPSTCRSARFDEVSKFDRHTGSAAADRWIQAKAGNTQEYSVYCPITKRTSGPGVTSGDGIQSVSVTTATAGLVECSLVTRRVSAGLGASPASDANLVGPTIKGSTTTAKTLTISTPATRPVRYWDANGTPPAGDAYHQVPAWYYSYLACRMAPGTKISGDIVIAEYGAVTGYTIDPMLTCPLTSDMAWRFDDGTTEPAGFTLAQASSSGNQFRHACSVPNNSVIEVAGTPTYINPSGCTLNDSAFATFTWPLSDPGYSGSWPSRVLSAAWKPVIGVPVNGTNVLYCGQKSALGDSKWFSYRVLPNRSHIGAPDNWVATASAGVASVNNAIDGVTTTRWSTGTAGKTGMYYQVYVGTSSIFNELTFDSGPDQDDYPRLFTVSGSFDGVQFYPIRQGVGSNHYVSFTFGENNYSYYRIRLDQDIKDGAGNAKYWSIRELNFHHNDGTH